MKKQNKLILSIPNPCNESWDKMSTIDKGKFCSHCQKTVTDITTMTDAEIVRLFQQQTDTHCIRAFSSQLNRKISLPTQAPTRFYKIAIALGLVLFSVSTKDSIGHSKSSLIEQNLLSNAQDSTTQKVDSNIFEIFGKVVDEEGNPLSGVLVKLLLHGILKSGAVTEDDGSFSVKSLSRLEHNDIYSVEFSTYTYKVVRANVSCKNLSQELSVQMYFDRSLNVSMGIMISIPTPNNDHGKAKFDEDDLKKLGF